MIRQITDNIFSMGKIDPRRLSRNHYQSLGREFWSTCIKAKDVKQLARFFDGLLSPSERIMIARRIRIAKRLLKEESKTEILQELKVGQATIDAVEHRLATMSKEEKKLLEM